jgi:hypothetical protein
MNQLLNNSFYQGISPTNLEFLTHGRSGIQTLQPDHLTMKHILVRKKNYVVYYAELRLI